MSPNDPSSDLDSRIAAIVERTVGRMRDELLHRVEDTETRLSNITGRLSGESPEPSPAEPAPPPAPASDRPGLSELFDAVVTIDRAKSQQEVLALLLEGVGRFASRSALFLTRADGAQGWGSYGFEESAGEIQGVSLSYADGPLAVLSQGRGCVALEAHECGEICRRMGASPGAEGLLVPFVLRDRVAATLYVDRRADETPLDRRSLQLLAYIAAQAVEGLAVRQRDETPTLQIAPTEPTTPGVALWEGATETAPERPEAAVPKPSVAPADESPPAAEEPAAEAPATPGPAPESIEPAASEPALSEPALTEPTLTEPEPSEPAVSEPAVSGPVWVAPALSEPAPADDAPAAAVTSEELSVPGDIAPAITEELPAVAVEPSGEGNWTMPLTEPATETEPAEEPSHPASASAEQPTLSAPAELPQQPESPTPDHSTTGLEPPAAPKVTAGIADSGESTEVRPPTDVSGPGWAFTASRAAAESGDEAQHEEARRLARLLVTEIKLYNEEQVEEGRRGNDIYPRLREDIDRSRQIFNERVDDAVRQETDYFHEEMVRILAGGNAEALGV